MISAPSRFVVSMISGCLATTKKYSGAGIARVKSVWNKKKSEPCITPPEACIYIYSLYGPIMNVGLYSIKMMQLDHVMCYLAAPPL